ncbi:MAG: phosphatidate cytidylyltransferase [Chloroflexi bacterium SZAS-1]|jgi:phytol kinase|nr:phosphatidate cytidylyltransferase [Chloroflexi bacterium SZAS-1]
MTTNDILGLVASYVYAIGLIALAEVLRRTINLPQELTRKLVHVGAGMWVFGTLALFDHWQWGVLPFATFIVGNYLFYRYRVFSSMDSANGTPGTVYFALAITVLFGLLWRPQGPIDRAPVAVAGTMALTWGDALAALVGQRYGWHRYRFGRSTRSWEGSITLFIAAAIAILLTLVWLPGSALSPLSVAPGNALALAAALVAALAAALAEAVSPHGTDNLSVPFVATLAVWLIAG